MEKTLLKIVDCGDSAVSIRFPQEISAEVHDMVISTLTMIKGAGLPGVLDVIPAYASIMVRFDPLITDGEAVKNAVSALLADKPVRLASSGEGRTVEIPVCYGGECGPDLENVVKHTGLDRDSVIAIHSGKEYPVHMIGFTAGFPYLGGMDERLATPRLKVPRTHIEAGSVGIAGAQTGIYSVASPGGWQIIGRTPLRLFSPDREEPFLVKAGDRIRFRSISEAEFRRLSEEQGADAEAEACEKREGDKVEAFADASSAPARTITLTRPGLLTTVQDTGRHGYLNSGISECGAMDTEALILGNRLLGNDPGAAGLEATLMTPGIRFGSDTEFCVTGGYCEIRFADSDQIIPMNEVVKAPAGTELLSVPVTLGCRTYLTFAGGIGVPSVLGSRSADSRASVGGISGGRKLAQGDVLPLADRVDEEPEQLSTLPRNTSQIGAAVRILFVTKGPQFGDLSDEGIDTFLAEEYTVSSDSDRMGTRFDGPRLGFDHGADGNIITDGVLRGAIQVVPSGQPILMNADAQVSGGYAKPFWLATVSRSAAAQLRPGDKVRFVLLSTGEAVKRLRG